MKYKDPITGEYKELFLKTSDTFPIGAITPYTSDEIPVNWLLCDGSAISRTEYSHLFNVIGTTFGEGDGETTFNLPDVAHNIVQPSLGLNYIIKSAMSVGVVGNVVNNQIESSKDTYSCDYINKNLKTTLKIAESFETNEYLGNKRIKGYLLEFTGPLNKDTEMRLQLPFADNIDKVWVDLSNSFYDNRLMTKSYNTRSFSGWQTRCFDLAIITQNILSITSDSNWSEGWIFTICVKYTEKD